MDRRLKRNGARLQSVPCPFCRAEVVHWSRTINMIGKLISELTFVHLPIVTSKSHRVGTVAAGSLRGILLCSWVPGIMGLEVARLVSGEEGSARLAWSVVAQGRT